MTARPDSIFNKLKRLKIVPITDLYHFGVLDWIRDFQNPDFADRFNWVWLYTPINEIFITALFSDATWLAE